LSNINLEAAEPLLQGSGITGFNKRTRIGIFLGLSAALIAVWLSVIAFINPSGEFMVNDDWAYVRAFVSSFYKNAVIATGWGPEEAPGGPSLLTHLLWAVPFVETLGFSQLTMRLSVLVAGVIGSLVLLYLLLEVKADSRLAFLASLTFVLNPLFLSQSFTYMCDVTFTLMLVVSVAIIFKALERKSVFLLILGLIAALAATLDRQTGIVVPVGLTVASILHPKGKEIGRLKIVFLSVVIVIIPWIGFEFLLAKLGSTPFTRNVRIYDLLSMPFKKGFPDYIYFLLGHFLRAGLAYLCCLISPLLALRYRDYWNNNLFRLLVLFATIVLAVFEVLILTGIYNAPPLLHRNVIYNFGIGPILLKDTYILGMHRNITFPTAPGYLIVYWVVIAMVVFAALVATALYRLVKTRISESSNAPGFFSTFVLMTALAYLSIICLTGFHDRYLIPLCALFIIWIVTENPVLDKFTWQHAFLSIAPLLIMGIFAIFGTRDFMEFKRSLANAHYNLIEDLRMDPCSGDGGFEFMGPRCFNKNHRPRVGMSWWWVEKEDYLITLGPMPGFSVTKTFPFKRWLGPDGAVYLLQPEKTTGQGS
jgi:4-amino-4-deoxy-L-arabinose transferase-like glycosyltransferase